VSLTDRPTLAALLGPLELRALEALWSRGEPACVRDLLDDFPGVAYTTLMTTLDRLHKKGILCRQRRGRAFRYAPAASRERLEAALAGRAMNALVSSLSSPAVIRPLIASFVEAVSRRDALALDELERLLRRRRRARSGRGER
jgi:predicted transcriptional regulator